MRIKDKATMYRLYQAGAFGNKLRTWPSVRDWAESGFAGRVGLRYAGRHGGGLAVYDLAPSQVWSQVHNWTSCAGADVTLIRPSEAAPDRDIIIQGEVCRLADGLHLRYSRVKSQMRPALAAESISVSGLRARMVLQAALSPSSFADLEALLEVYPDSVVEFGAYRYPLGNIPGRNTLVWEVRNY